MIYKRNNLMRKNNSLLCNVKQLKYIKNLAKELNYYWLYQQRKSIAKPITTGLMAANWQQ